MGLVSMHYVARPQQQELHNMKQIAFPLALLVMYK